MPNRNNAQVRVAPLVRPPVRAATIVRSDIAHTFDTFVRRVGAWWPAQPFSAGKDRVRDITIEPRPDGRVYETWDDGSVVDWGQITHWDRPAAFTMTWLGTPKPTEVELRFAGLGPSLTRVTVEHRGWETLTDAELGEDCALPGGYASGAYSQGWERVLAAFASTFDTNADEAARP